MKIGNPQKPKILTFPLIHSYFFYGHSVKLYGWIFISFQMPLVYRKSSVLKVHGVLQRNQPDFIHMELKLIKDEIFAANIFTKCTCTQTYNIFCVEKKQELRPIYR